MLCVTARLLCVYINARPRKDGVIRLNATTNPYKPRISKPMNFAMNRFKANFTIRVAPRIDIMKNENSVDEAATFWDKKLIKLQS